MKLTKGHGFYFLFLLMGVIFLNGEITGQKKTYNNPILPGFYPDPSICRVGEDYYLVTSTFEYYPGIPVFHSKDLVNWEQLGYALNRPGQLGLDSVRPSGGVYAPTIRYHDGTYYIINTLVGKGGNFIVTAKDVAGPWSDPYWLKDGPGIDPSLFFDDDGKAYYTGNIRPDTIPSDSKYREIWLNEINLKTMKFTGERTIILREGALHGANNAEAPHIYKVKGTYYLMIAEGGTGENHAVTIFRSKNIRGPYEGNKKNPILTHRHLGSNYPIACTGHADLVETQKGDWWMVLLAVRPYGGFHFNLGRETFLTPVIWEDGWPVVSPGNGRVLEQYTVPDLPEHVYPILSARDNFDKDTLRCEWNFIRTPRTQFYSLTERKNYLRLRLKKETITGWENPSFIGRRQQHINFSASTAIEFMPEKENETAGIVLLQNNDFQFRIEKMLVNGKPTVRLTKRFKGKDVVLGEIASTNKRFYLKAEASGQSYNFYYAEKENEWNVLKEDVDGRTLSRTNAGGFVGTYIGIYASGNGKESSSHADFDWFEYKGNE
jgi:xylan 1,4-beta-xylosidase